ncbi:hypothetical protein WJX74_004707 [Apatococcus lobatus]|uniref:Methyltransferase domain-containing protein n=1 Tax=Apatococcus lobatus TaxID=904363 RepID=A0AAW1SAY1_9CHLO
MSSQKNFFELVSWFKYYLPFTSYVAPFHGAPTAAAKQLLRLGRVSASDTVFDLGCGDGRLLIAASQSTKAKCIGYELDAGLVQEAIGNICSAGFEELIEIRHQDAQQALVEHATVILMYLSHDGNLKLYHALKSRMRPGTRLLTLAFPIAALEPAVTAQAAGLDLYVYEVTLPLR